MAEYPNIEELLKAVAQRIWTEPAEGAKFVSDPDAYLAREGVDQTATYEDLDLGDVVTQVAPNVDLSDENTTIIHEAAYAPSPAAYSAAAAPAKSAPAPSSSAPAAPATAAAAASSSGGSSSGGGVTYDQIKELMGVGVEQVVNHNYDYSQEFNFEDITAEDGDVKIDLENTNAFGDGAVAAGHDATGVATGDQAVAVGDDIKDDAQVNTGDGAVLADGDIKAPVNTGEMDQSILADGDVFDTQIGEGNVQDVHDSQVATGDNNVQVDSKGGDIGAVGDNNAVIQNSDHVNAGFGDGNVTEIDDSHIDDSALAFGDGDAAAVDTDTTVDNSINESFNTDQDDHSNTNQATNQETKQIDKSDDDIENVGNVDADQSFNEVDQDFEDVTVDDDLETIED